MATTEVDLTKVIKEAIDARVAEVANEEFEEALKRIEKRRSEIVTGTVLAIESFISMERLGPTIRIEIKERVNGQKDV